MDCIFCKIANKDVPSDIVLETDSVLAFRDVNPQAPVHVLVIPKKHINGIESASEKDDLNSLLLVAAEVAKIENIENSGYRIVINSGPHGGQTVFHLHVHVLGGRVMTWPPG